jgi:hypothetical protein
MIPRTRFQLNTDIPESHAGWTPRGNDLDDEGIGFFRDTWIIRGVTIKDARQVIRSETAMVNVVGSLSEDAATFDLISKAFEDRESELIPDDLREDSRIAELETMSTDVTEYTGLELGVGGLVFALSAAGYWPAASCRGHPTDYAWSDRPIVFIACDRHRANALKSLLNSAHCGFCYDPSRTELIAVEAESIEEILALAQLVVDARASFVRHRSPKSGETLTRPFGSTGATFSNQTHFDF